MYSLINFTQNTVQHFYGKKSTLIYSNYYFFFFAFSDSTTIRTISEKFSCNLKF